MTTGVAVEDLSIRSRTGAELLARTSFQVPPGTITAITGPSGAGKTTLMRAVLGHLAVGAIRVSGSIHIDGQDVFGLDRAALQTFRRENLAYVGQDPGAALNPVMRVGALLAEAAPRSVRAERGAALRRVGLPEHMLRSRPGELSGGEQRRVALASALVRGAGVLVVDEPLAGLHGQLRNEIAELLRSVAADDKVAVLVSGHDTATLHGLADAVVSLGEPRAASLRASSASSVPGRIAPLAKGFRDSRPVLDHGVGAEIALRAKEITARAGTRTLVASIDLSVGAGESVALVGPSGAGKTTVARVLAGLHPQASGTLQVNGRSLGVGHARRSRRDRRRIQLIPQNPLSTLNPKHTVLQTLSRPLRLTGVRSREVADRAAALLHKVELDPTMLYRYPDELSGGQRQRVAIARALAAEPEVLICDEITSALDADTAAAIMKVIDRTREDRGIGVLVISHDMSVVAGHCHRVFVLADGRVVESGKTAAVLGEPTTPQTRALLA
ncbi:ABC transporter ATP-binding protein [Nocardia flavorosea]|uniref:ABC transporter ATP-binding protein n=1 Tax=Nocardia flavorosea TaxID=53429 RepID=UPI001894A4AD|nr:ATP-binding cassette domain-containing protein [Nocardia flavorosea]MBF6348489.1 ABC transporter ATP-binding protein [Nocardia flavorosea]